MPGSRHGAFGLVRLGETIGAGAATGLGGGPVPLVATPPDPQE